MGHFDGLRYLSRSEVALAASSLDAVGIVRDALVRHARGETTLPDEAYLPWSAIDGSFARSLALPGAVWSDPPVLGVKVINSSLANPAQGRARAQGLTILFDRDSAYPVAVMEAAYLSALRTSAYTVLSVLLLGVNEVKTVAVIGSGALGESHIRLLWRTFPALQFRLYDKSEKRRDELVTSLRSEGCDCLSADSAEVAVRDAEVVVTTTTTADGYLPHCWLAPGAVVAHVSLDDVMPDVVTGADLVVVDDWQLVSTDDRRLLGRMWREGALLGPNGEAFEQATARARRVDATLADIAVGRHPGRTAEEQIVLSNPFGMGILDVALAGEVLRVAERQDVGTFLLR